jgi:hypothetical protein
MARRKQLWFLIGLSAASAVAQYVVQGAMAGGGSPQEFSRWFWYADYGLWGARALIEAWVIVYLFQTQARTRGQAVVLTVFEVALVGLITLTLGPALRSLGYGRSMRATLPEPWFTGWNFGIAAYTSLMMGAAGLAYRVQPEDAGDETAALRAELAGARADYREAQEALEQARAEVEAVKAWSGLPARAKAAWVAVYCRDDDRPSARELAEVLGVSRQTVSAGYNSLQDG